jgi:DnaJ-class molecular chaperone
MSIDFDPTVDHYKVLGVDPKASADEIKKAYRKLAKQNHPDSTGGDKAKESRFKEINAAYDVLGDGRKRGQYDAMRDQIRSGGFRPGAGFPPSAGGGFAGSGGFSGGAWDIGDLFAQMFSGAGGAAGGRGGRVRVDNFHFGADADELPRQKRRRGEDEVEPETKIQASDGSWLIARDADVHSDVRIPFDRAILGTVAEVPTVDGKASVKIPPGTSSGRKLRLRGKGVPGRSGRIGDHYVTVQIDVPKDLDDEAQRLLAQLVQRTRKS